MMTTDNSLANFLPVFYLKHKKYVHSSTFNIKNKTHKSHGGVLEATFHTPVI